MVGVGCDVGAQTNNTTAQPEVNSSTFLTAFDYLRYDKLPRSRILSNLPIKAHKLDHKAQTPSPRFVWLLLHEYHVAVCRPLLHSHHQPLQKRRPLDPSSVALPHYSASACVWPRSRIKLSACRGVQPLSPPHSQAEPSKGPSKGQAIAKQGPSLAQNTTETSPPPPDAVLRPN